MGMCLSLVLLGLTKKVTTVRSGIAILFVRTLGFVAHDSLLQLNNLSVSIDLFIIRS